MRNPYMGADSENYVRAFEVISQRGTYYMEKGYVWLNRLVASFTSSYTVLICIINFFFFAALYWYIKKNVDSKFWLYCIVIIGLQPYIFLQTTFNIIRQECSISLTIIGMFFYINAVKFKHKYTGFILYIIFVLLGAQFHRSTYALLLIPIIFRIKWSKNKWRLLAFVFFMLNLFRASRFLSAIERWFGHSNYSNHRATLLDNVIYIFLLVCYIFWVTSFYDDLKIDVWKKRFLDLYLFSITFLVFAISNNMVYRMYISLAILSLPGIEYIMSNDRSPKMRFSVSSKSRVGSYSTVLTCYYIAFWCGYILYLSLSNNTAYVPYRFL